MATMWTAELKASASKGVEGSITKHNLTNMPTVIYSKALLGEVGRHGGNWKVDFNSYVGLLAEIR